MKKKLAAFALSGALFCSLGIPALAAEGASSPAAEVTEAESRQLLPDSQLYCGEVKELITGEDGALVSLHMDSPQFGELVMNLSDETFWIDSEKRTASSPSGLQAGEQLYVFHSPITTRSLPPQSAAFAVVRNISQDTGGAQYKKVEAVEVSEDGKIQITTDNGGLFLFAGEETSFSAYVGNAPEGLDGIQAGSHIMAWYDAVALSYPGQAYAQHIMVLNREEDSEPLTRSALAVLLHTAQGSPVVNYALNYGDVDPGAPYAEALRWASSEKLISGYGNGNVGPGDAVNREQMAVIFWRWAGSPMLMDYTGLTGYTDVEDISQFAQSALAWAHQKGLLVPADGRLGPKDAVTLTEAEAMLTALREQNTF